MAVAPMIVRADLDRRFTPLTVQRFADDVGDGATAEEKIDEAIGEATSEAYTILRVGYTNEQIAELAVQDPVIRGACADIAISLLARRRNEFFGPDGKTLYSSTAAEARKKLERIAAAQLRPPGEATAGPNRLVGMTTNRPATSLIFQGNSSNPRPRGGF